MWLCQNMPPLCSPVSPLLCARVARLLLRSAYAQLTLYSPPSVTERMWREGEGWRAGGVGGGGVVGHLIDRYGIQKQHMRSPSTDAPLHSHPPPPPQKDGQLSSLQTETHLSNAAQGSRTGGGTFSVVSQSGRGQPSQATPPSPQLPLGPTPMAVRHTAHAPPWRPGSARA